MWRVYFLYTGVTPRVKLNVDKTAAEWDAYFSTENCPEVIYKTEYTEIAGFTADAELEYLHINEKGMQTSTFYGFNKVDSAYAYNADTFNGFFYTVLNRGYRDVGDTGDHWFRVQFEPWLSASYSVEGRLEQGQADNTTGENMLDAAEEVSFSNVETLVKGVAFDGILVGTSVVGTNIFTQVDVPTYTWDGLTWYAIPFDGTDLTFDNFQESLAKRTTGQPVYYPLRTDGIKAILPIVYSHLSKTGLTEWDFGDYKVYMLGLQPPTFTYVATDDELVSKQIRDFRTIPFIGENKKANLLTPLTLHLYDFAIQLYDPVYTTRYRRVSVDYRITYDGGLSIDGVLSYWGAQSSKIPVKKERFAAKLASTFNIINNEFSEILLNQRAGYFEGLLTNLASASVASAVTGDVSRLAGAALGGIGGAISAYRDMTRTKTQGVSMSGGMWANTQNGFAYLTYYAPENVNVLISEWNARGYKHPSMPIVFTIGQTLPRTYFCYRRMSLARVWGVPRSVEGIAPREWCEAIERTLVDGVYIVAPNTESEKGIFYNLKILTSLYLQNGGG